MLGRRTYQAQVECPRDEGMSSLMMRSSILFVRGGREVAAQRCRYLQQTTSKVHQRQLHLNTTHHRRYWPKQNQRESVLRSISSTSPAYLSSSPDTSFHGLTLDGKKEEHLVNQQHDPSAQPNNNNNNNTTTTQIQEAEVVESDEEKQRTHEFIKEMTRAELSAHSIINDNSGNNNDDDASEGAIILDPYERRMQQLNQVQQTHQIIDPQQTVQYVQSLMNMGELHYQLGDMKDSFETYMDALQRLMENGDAQQQQLLTAQCLHSIGAIHARCGEYDEALNWYEESLKKKQQLMNHYELGKTYNALAALEVMKGGEVQWDRAMLLFEDAERNYLYGYCEVDSETPEGKDCSSTELTKETLHQMSPQHLNSIINVRSNMGELLKQRGKYQEAIEKLRLSLDMAKLALEVAHEKTASSSSSTTSNIDEPSPDEQRNAIVDLQLKIADTLMSGKMYDEAAEAYEQALSSHIYFRKWIKDNKIRGDTTERSFNQQQTILPATIPDATTVKLDLTTATTVEAAIRSNLAKALANIGQEKLSMEHCTVSLAIKRHIAGDGHMEVAHTLMQMGALNGGPLRDFTKALVCFKEALYIYRSNLEDSTKKNASSNSQVFFGDEEAEEYDRHIQNALKNISLIEAALLKDRDGVKKQTGRR